MPITICPKHGRQGAVAVCKHLGSDFKAELPLRSGRRIRLAEGEDDMLAFPIRFCEECLRHYSIPDDVSTLPFEETLDKYPELESPNLFCGKCFQERLDGNVV